MCRQSPRAMFLWYNVSVSWKRKVDIPNNPIHDIQTIVTGGQISKKILKKKLTFFMYAMVSASFYLDTRKHLKDMKI